jgi:hypothetical protein
MLAHRSRLKMFRLSSGRLRRPQRKLAAPRARGYETPDAATDRALL